MTSLVGNINVNKLYVAVNMASRRESGGASHSSASDEEVPTDRGSFQQPYAFEPTSARVNYHDDAESSGSESDDGFQPLGSRLGSGRSDIR